MRIFRKREKRLAAGTAKGLRDEVAGFGMAMGGLAKGDAGMFLRSVAKGMKGAARTAILGGALMSAAAPGVSAARIDAMAADPVDPDIVALSEQYGDIRAELGCVVSNLRHPGCTTMDEIREAVRMYEAEYGRDALVQKAELIPNAGITSEWLDGFMKGRKDYIEAADKGRAWMLGYGLTQDENPVIFSKQKVESIELVSRPGSEAQTLRVSFQAKGDPDLAHRGVTAEIDIRDGKATGGWVSDADGRREMLTGRDAEILKGMAWDFDEKERLKGELGIGLVGLKDKIRLSPNDIENVRIAANRHLIANPRNAFGTLPSPGMPGMDAIREFIATGSEMWSRDREWMAKKLLAAMPDDMAIASQDVAAARKDGDRIAIDFRPPYDDLPYMSPVTAEFNLKDGKPESGRLVYREGRKVTVHRLEPAETQALWQRAIESPMMKGGLRFADSAPASRLDGPKGMGGTPIPGNDVPVSRVEMPKGMGTSPIDAPVSKVERPRGMGTSPMRM